jgi:hypothetical protein
VQEEHGAPASSSPCGRGYLSPNMTLQELRVLMSEGKQTLLVDFSEACRVELDDYGVEPDAT